MHGHYFSAHSLTETISSPACLQHACDYDTSASSGSAAALMWPMPRRVGFWSCSGKSASPSSLWRQRVLTLPSARTPTQSGGQFTLALVLEFRPLIHWLVTVLHALHSYLDGLVFDRHPSTSAFLPNLHVWHCPSLSTASKVLKPTHPSDAGDSLKRFPTRSCSPYGNSRKV